MRAIIKSLKYIFELKNGKCEHEKLWRTKSGHCYVCDDSIPLERALRLFEVLGVIKRIKNEQ